MSSNPQGKRGLCGLNKRKKTDGWPEGCDYSFQQEEMPSYME